MRRLFNSYKYHTLERKLLYLRVRMEQRRFGDIMAFKTGNQPPVAFHARNLEVAEISEELWSSFANPQNTLSDLQEWEQENNPDVKANVESRVQSITLNVTQICNLACTYCAAGGDGTYGQPQTKISVEKTLPQILFFLGRMKAGDLFRITFLGGEPLLYPEGIRVLAEYVIKECKDRNLKSAFSIVTNGTLLNLKNVQMLNEIGCSVGISLDGPASTNDIVRVQKNGSGSTQLVIEGAKLLSQNRSGIERISFHGVFTKENMNPYEAYKFYQNFDFDSYEFTYDVNSPNEDLNREFINQMSQIAEEAYEVGGEAELRKIMFFDSVFQTLDAQQRNENFCRSGKTHFVVDAKNNIFTCPWDVGQEKEKVGEGSYLSLTKLAPYQQPLVDKNYCHKCWARFVCGGGCMYIHKQNTGEKYKKDPIFCDRIRNLITIAITYYKQSREIC